MRVKIIISNVSSFIFSLLSMIVKGKYALSNSLWLSIPYSFCALLLALYLLLNYDKNLSFWAPKNKKQEMNYIFISGGCIISLLVSAIGRW